MVPLAQMYHFQPENDTYASRCDLKNAQSHSVLSWLPFCLFFSVCLFPNLLIFTMISNMMSLELLFFNLLLHKVKQTCPPEREAITAQEFCIYLV